jgi:hypothetical protein
MDFDPHIRGFRFSTEEISDRSVGKVDNRGPGIRYNSNLLPEVIIHSRVIVNIFSNSLFIPTFVVQEVITMRMVALQVLCGSPIIPGEREE